MKAGARPGAEAIALKGRFAASKWLLARRFVQLSILALFLLGPWFGIWIVKGNLNASLTLDVLPLTDPYVLLQTLLSGHVPELTAITGALIVLVFYLLVGGRVYCAWVCPVNMVTDGAQWLRERLGITGASRLSRSARYWILGATLFLAAVTGSVAWELVNPVSMLHRGLFFGMGLGWLIVLAVFLLDLLVSRRAWCGHLCPVGAFYSLLGRYSLVRVRADRREQCDDCMDCFAVCPEQQVIRPALKGAEKGIGPVILSPNCTNCGRCIDVCARDVFRFGSRFNNRADFDERTHHSPGVEVLR
ncbi:MAG TPA: quinol dehydrogenase ferredoxin subunit NapH [Gammaproteobacteria bacterium]|nr:quinol dehydrogenase ferredoxin subunit NapH [Gammaproteobacteria bacterium]